MELAARANVSARHLGFVEVGRASPSRALVLRLAEELDVPLRQRNAWLNAAGFASVFGNGLLSDPSFEAVRRAIDFTLEVHKPFPAFAIDRLWNVVASNAALPELYEGVNAELLDPPVNVLRLSLHPSGLAPRIVNIDAWATHLLTRLRREIELTADAELENLMEEAKRYYRPAAFPSTDHDASGVVAVPLHIMTRLGKLSFLSTVTVFGTPIEVALSEIALEMLFPADQRTADLVRAASKGSE